MSTTAPTAPNNLGVTHILTSATATVRSTVKLGLSTITGLSPHHRAQVDALIKSNLANKGWSVDQDALAADLDVDIERASAIVTVCSLVIALTSMSTESPRFLAGELAKHGFTDSESTATAESLLTDLAPERDVIKRTMDRNSLASAVMPSFSSLYTTLDVRLRFKDSGIDLAVPVVIVRFQTDDEANVVMQMTESDVIRVMEQLEKIKDQIALANKWIPDSL